MELLPGEDAEFLAALGRFTVRFAAAEACLDICNTIIFNYCGGDSVQPEIPRSLERKIAYFNDCQKTCKLASADKGFGDWATDIIREFSSIRSDRHFLIHGMGWQLLKDGKITIAKLEYEKTHLREVEKVMSLTFVIELGDRSWQLENATLKYGVFLLRFIPTDKLDKALRELDVEFLRTFPLC